MQMGLTTRRLLLVSRSLQCTRRRSTLRNCAKENATSISFLFASISLLYSWFKVLQLGQIFICIVCMEVFDDAVAFAWPEMPNQTPQSAATPPIPTPANDPTDCKYLFKGCWHIRVDILINEQGRRYKIEETKVWHMSVRWRAEWSTEACMLTWTMNGRIGTLRV